MSAGARRCGGGESSRPAATQGRTSTATRRRKPPRPAATQRRTGTATRRRKPPRPAATQRRTSTATRRCGSGNPRDRRQPRGAPTRRCGGGDPRGRRQLRGAATRRCGDAESPWTGGNPEARRRGNTAMRRREPPRAAENPRGRRQPRGAPVRRCGGGNPRGRRQPRGVATRRRDRPPGLPDAVVQELPGPGNVQDIRLGANFLGERRVIPRQPHYVDRGLVQQPVLRGP